ncbi:hypothetical protein BJF78_20320 [Pseudonocardia sp. CNS-139]|nr:hypothetical protein BJF78_20320 [Pseudonocardia sp. CNS-139]
MLAQWAPLPMELPYLVHVALTLVVLAAVVRVPETRPAGPAVRTRVHVPVRFRRVVAPMAPWVFGAPAVSFAVQPAALGAAVGPYGLVYATLLTVLTLGAGVAVQPWARRLDARSPSLTAPLGLVALTLGILLAAGAAASGVPALAAPASVVLGAAFGFCLVAGLLEVQRMAAPEHLGGLTAIYYTLTYGGFAIPVLLAALTGVAGYPALLLVLAALAALSLVAVVRGSRAPGRASAPRSAARTRSSRSSP